MPVGEPGEQNLLEQQQGGAAEPVAAEPAPAAPAATDSVLAPERVRIHAGSYPRI